MTSTPRDAPQSELLPCAHCGSQCFEQREEGEVMNLFKIICSNVDCGAQTCGWGLRSSARKAWNRRAPAEGGWRTIESGQEITVRLRWKEHGQTWEVLSGSSNLDAGSLHDGDTFEFTTHWGKPATAPSVEHSTIAARRQHLEEAVLPLMAAGIDCALPGIAERAADPFGEEAKRRRAECRRLARAAFQLIPHFALNLAEQLSDGEAKGK